MIRHVLSGSEGDERGMTLAELLLALAITGLIMSTLVTAIYQIYHVTGWGGNQMRVQHDLQNAATWLNRDVVSASRADVSGSQMVLTIPYLSTGTILTRTITYTHSAPHLIRDSGVSTVTVASHVGSVAFSPTGKVTSAITITITSWASNVTQSTTLHLDMRPTE